MTQKKWFETNVDYSRSWVSLAVILIIYFTVPEELREYAFRIVLALTCVLFYVLGRIRKKQKKNKKGKTRIDENLDFFMLGGLVLLAIALPIMSNLNVEDIIPDMTSDTEISECRQKTIAFKDNLGKPFVLYTGLVDGTCLISYINEFDGGMEYYIDDVDDVLSPYNWECLYENTGPGTNQCAGAWSKKKERYKMVSI